MAKNKAKELDTLQKKLSHFLNENALLKYMLSEIVDENQEKSFLPVAEYFQNELLLKDEKLKSLSKSVNELTKKFQQEYLKKYDIHTENLQKEILRFQNEYESFSRDFKSKFYGKNA